MYLKMGGINGAVGLENRTCYSLFRRVGVFVGVNSLALSPAGVVLTVYLQ